VKAVEDKSLDVPEELCCTVISPVMGIEPGFELRDPRADPSSNVHSTLITPRKELAMSRPKCRVRPAVDQLDTKSLLSAGAIGFAAGGNPAVFAKKAQQSGYYNFINIQTSGFNATDVTWQLWGQRNPDRPDVLLQSGRIGKLGSSAVQIASTVPSSNSLPADFRFTYKVGSQTEHADAQGTSWNRQGNPPYIPSFTLPAHTGSRRLSGRNPADKYYYFANINNNTGVNNLTVNWSAYYVNPSGPPSLYQSGSITAGLGVNAIETMPGTSSMAPSYFVFQFTIGGQSTTTPNDSATRSSSSPIPNLSDPQAQNLYASTGAQSAGNYYYFANIDNNTGVNPLTVNWYAYDVNPSEPPSLYQFGSIPAGMDVNGIVTKMGPLSMAPNYFVFTFTIGGQQTKTPKDYAIRSSTSPVVDLSTPQAQNLSASAGAHGA
jgi:hypothetical protein